MTTIDIKYDDRQVRDALNRLLQGSRDMSPAMRVIAGHLEEGALQAFADKRAPDGTRVPRRRGDEPSSIVICNFSYKCSPQTRG